MRLVARSGAILGASVVVLAGADAHARAIAPPDGIAHGFSVVPGLTIRETLTNNSQLPITDRKSDLITQVTPSVRTHRTVWQYSNPQDVQTGFRQPDAGPGTAYGLSYTQPDPSLRATLVDQLSTPMAATTTPSGSATRHPWA